MSERLQYEAWLLLLSVLTGGWLMMAYDCLRLFRLVIRHNPFFVGLEDFLYWVYAGLVTFMLLYEQNDGAFRMPVIVGVFLGMILYDRFISRFVFGCLKKLGKWFKIIRNRCGRDSACNHTSGKVGE